MTSMLISLLVEDAGQDLIEYTLLLAFVVVTMAGLVLGIGESVQHITSISNSQLTAAKNQLP